AQMASEPFGSERLTDMRPPPSGGCMDGILFQGLVMGVGAYVVVRCLLTGFFTVDQNERAVKTSFGRAKRLASPGSVDGPAGDSLDDEERQRYQYPQLEVIHRPLVLVH